MKNDLFAKVNNILVKRDGITQYEESDLLCEYSIDVYAFEELLFKLTNCSCEHLRELIAGHLVTEGYLTDYLSSSLEIIVSADIKKADIICETGIDVIRKSSELMPVIPIDYKEEWIFNLADCFAEGTYLHDLTNSSHSCFLAKEKEILFSCEDIGRHNAFDKAVGYALLNNIDLTKCMIYTSGRVPRDMVRKAINAGIPILCSKAAATKDAVILAKKYALTLICSARKDSYKIYE